MFSVVSDDVLRCKCVHCTVMMFRVSSCASLIRICLVSCAVVMLCGLLKIKMVLNVVKLTV